VSGGLGTRIQHHRAQSRACAIWGTRTAVLASFAIVESLLKRSHSRESGNPLLNPCKHGAENWIPAFAGMTASWVCPNNASTQAALESDWMPRMIPAPTTRQAWEATRGQCGEANPSKPNRVKPIAFKNLTCASEKQTQWTYLTCYEPLAKVLPLFFAQNGCTMPRNRPPISAGKILSKANPNKPIWVNSFRLNKMSCPLKKQTQMGYQAYYQSIVEILPLFFDENGWMHVPRIPAEGGARCFICRVSRVTNRGSPSPGRHGDRATLSPAPRRGRESTRHKALSLWSLCENSRSLSFRGARRGERRGIS